MKITEIIKLARAAGFQVETDWAGRPSTLVIKDSGMYLRVADEIVRFATLVRNAALEEAAEEFEGLYTDQQRPQNIAAAIRAMKEQT